MTMNEATKQKIRQSLLGHKLSEVTKQKISFKQSQIMKVTGLVSMERRD